MLRSPSRVGVGGALILPYLEGGTISEQIDFKKEIDPASASGYSSLKNFQLAATLIPAYLCPSDTNTGGLLGYTGGSQNGNVDEEDLRSTNMAGVTDSVNWLCDPSGTNPDGLRPRKGSAVDGVMAANYGSRIKDITDGTSKTIVVGEVTGDIPGNYQGFYWATYDLADTKEGINGPNTLPGLGTYALGSAGIAGFRKAGFSSWHPGGCHFVFCDGSVSFVTEDISAQVLKSLTTRAGVSTDNVIDVITP